MGAVAVVLAVTLRDIQVTRSIEDARQRAIIAAQVAYQPHLTDAELTNDFIPLLGEQVAELDEVSRSAISDTGIVRIKIWNQQHWIVYSDNADLIGRWFAGDAELQQALAGDIASQVTGLAGAEEMEERDFGTLLSVYVPLRVDADGRFTSEPTGTVVGAFEIYVPYAPVEAAIASDTRTLYVSIGLGFVVLYLGLFRLVFGASRRLRRQSAENAFQATHDALTALPNRRLLIAHTQRLLDSATPATIAPGEAHAGRVGLILLDLDRFKEINDTLGHASGDEVLIAVADRLTTELPGSVVARVGGDEFVVVAADLADGDAGLALCDRIEALLEEPIEVGGIALCVRASAGLAMAPEHGRSGDELLQHADVAMYVAKRLGTIRCLYAPELDHYSPERLGLAAELRGALADGQITVAYQPKMDFATGEVHALEALVRWHHPERGFISPGEFLPIIENTELIGPLTWEVLGQAMSRCALWRQAGIDVQVAVNLSARTVADPMLVDEVRAVLARHGLPASALELELTESAVLGDHARATEILDSLRDLGVSLAVDDFGTGYASISYLTTLPLDVLKIDQSFVKDLLTDSTAAAVVGFTLDLSRHLGLHVVAEGIEDAATLERLRTLGCDMAQGYFIARPMPAEQVADWITSWNSEAVRSRSAAATPLAGSMAVGE